MLTTTLTFRGRLPGVSCDPALPEVELPVRLDVAGFVGFAERGPLDVAVPVEDMTQYATIFGGDLALAQLDGDPVYAQLPSAVRGFFDNGGRRCYVVRVAGSSAVAARLRVPGVELWPSAGSADSAYVEAAWPGSWSEGVAVDTVLSRRLLRPASGYTKRTATEDGILPLAPGETLPVEPGDLLRLDLGPAHPRLFARVRVVDTANSTVMIDQERAFDGGTADEPAHNAPAKLTALPGHIDVVEAVELLRFDLIARRHTETDSRVLERHTDVSFQPSDGSSRSWTDALQTVDAGQPDLTRSLTLRQDEATMSELPDCLAVPVAMSEPSSPLDQFAPIPDPIRHGRDDLDTFDAKVFIDARLAADTVYTVTTHADDLTWSQQKPPRLRGIHALIGVDEVAVVAVPDAGQRGWTPVPTPPTDPAPVPPAAPPVNWSLFRCCAVESEPPANPPPPTPPTPAAGLPALDPIGGYDPDPLLSVQISLVTMCAARADQLALLSVPDHYDVADVLAWRATLANDPRVSDASSAGASPLSFATSWHPWVSVPTTQSGGHAVLRNIPPDGVVAGMIAARELTRGAWIAPAGTPLSGVLRLTRALSDSEAIRLFDAHTNLLVQQPGMFCALSAHTLSGDPRHLQVSVRRLVILLRKIALLLGARYTFEVNNDGFRQLVRMRFDRILTALMRRGALHAFRVVTDGSVNTAADQDSGRFFVELQIAPTSPVEFITVTLVRTGEGLLEVLEG